MRNKPISNKPEVYVEQLKKGAGVDRAIRIAQARMNATDPKGYGELPKGVIFTEADRKGKLPLGEAHLTQLHNWWKQCYHILRKQENSKK